MIKEEEKADLVYEVIQKRYSPVIFSDQQIGDDVLFRLFEAARWAPSSFNDQPWNFIYGRKGQDSVYKALFETLMDDNKRKARHAPVLVLSVANMISPTTHKENPYAFHDVGMAMGNLLLQATALDVYVHQMGGYYKKKAREILNIPRTHKPVAMMAMGYKGVFEKFPEDLQQKEQKPRTRREIKDFVFNKAF
ncbi:MAG: nitroreductase family protein [Bacteroidales bacterium]